MSDYLLHDLRQAIASGHALVVVGTGVSRIATNNARAAAWDGLLDLGIQRCVDIGKADAAWADRRRADLTSGDLDELLGVAEQVERRLGAPDGGEYRRWLGDTVGALHPVNRDVLDALAALGLPLATTNYDSLLEEATGLPAITWREGAKVERVIRGDERAILHLHGYWDDAASVVLGIKSYEDVTRDPHAQAVLRGLRLTRTLVFVGFKAGLGDPNFGALLRWSRTLFAGSEYRQFRIVREPEVEEAKQQHPDEERTFALSYGKEYADLASFLRGLPPPSSSGGGGPPSPSPPPSPALSRLPSPPLCLGRDPLLTDLVTELLTTAPRPVPVLGGPGIGKTTIALAALHDKAVAAKYGNRRYFIRCDGTTTGEAILGEVARAAGLPPGSTLADAVVTHLGAGPAVVVLDNAETPWEADTEGTENVLRALAAIPTVALVVALRGGSRPLGVLWREAITVPPLADPDDKTLFLTIAGERFRDDPHLPDLLGALGGVPLAVELLAFVAEVEPDLAGVWARWQAERTQMLRRQGVRDIEVSFELSITGPRMTDEARLLLALLGVLPEGIAHGDLEALLPGAGMRAAATLRQVGLAFDERGRLLVLAPVREYVAQRHPPAPDDLDRVGGFYVVLVSDQLPKTGSEGRGVAILRLLPDLSNLETIVVTQLRSVREQIQRNLTLQDEAVFLVERLDKLADNFLSFQRGIWGDVVSVCREIGETALADRYERKLRETEAHDEAGASKT